MVAPRAADRNLDQLTSSTEREAPMGPREEGPRSDSQESVINADKDTQVAKIPIQLS